MPLQHEITFGNRYKWQWTGGFKFEDKEQELFGEDGFEKIVVQVAGLEKQLGLFDLPQFTPKA